MTNVGPCNKMKHQRCNASVEMHVSSMQMQAGNRTIIFYGSMQVHVYVAESCMGNMISKTIVKLVTACKQHIHGSLMRQQTMQKHWNQQKHGSI